MRVREKVWKALRATFLQVSVIRSRSTRTTTAQILSPELSQGISVHRVDRVDVVARESQTVAAPQHANIVPAFTAGEVDAGGNGEAVGRSRRPDA